MSSEIFKFIKNVPIGSLEKYFEGVFNDLIEEVKWDLDDKSVKKSLLNIAESVTGEKLAALISHAERINALTDELGQNILKHSVRDDELEEYYQLENEFDRALWMYLKDADRFLQVEDCWYTDTRRQGRMWEAFVGPVNLKISSDGDHLKSFKDKLMELFRAVGNIKIDVYERKRSEGEDEEVDVIQVMVYREDLPITQREFENNNLISKIVKPVKEVASLMSQRTGILKLLRKARSIEKLLQKFSLKLCFSHPLKATIFP